MKSRNVRILLTVGLVILAGVLVAARRGGGPPVEWTPEKVTETAVAGQETTVEVSFTPRRDLGPVELRVVPELASLLAVSPATLPEVTEGEPVQVLLTFTPPVDSENGVSLDGVIQVRGQRGQTFARPLPVELKVVWPTFATSNIPLTLQYPAKFKVDSPGGGNVVGSNGQVALVHPETGEVLSITWTSTYPAGTPLEDWADSVEWPFPDNDWQAHYALISLNGRQALQLYDPDSGSILVPIEEKLLAIFNGEGINPIYMDRGTFEEILESVVISETPN